MRAFELADVVGGHVCGSPDAEFSEVSLDSRQVKAGSLFVAIKGSRYDGHDFIGEAFQRGAFCALCEKKTPVPEGKAAVMVGSTVEALKKLASYRRSKFSGKVVAVAGSVGKTTTKELIYFLLSQRYRCYRAYGNFNSQIGLPLSLSNAPLDVDFIVLEMGASQVGDVSRLVSIARPHIRVLTSLGEEHLETFGTFENVVKGNGEIFNDLGEYDVAVLPHSALRFYKLDGHRVVTFGEGGRIHFSDVVVSLDGLNFYFKGERFHVPTVSLGVAENLMAGFAVLTALGIDPLSLKEAVSRFTAVKGRMCVYKFKDFYLIDDTYNANPASTRNALITLSKLENRGVKVAVLGDMLELGVRSKELHAEIGFFINELDIDVAIFYGQEMYEAFKISKKCNYMGIFAKTIDDLLEEILHFAGDGNIILLKGSRGMRMEEVVSRLREIKDNA